MSYGIEVRGPNNSTPVLSSRLRASNVVVFSAFSLDPNVSVTISCADANDSTRVAITLMGPNTPFGNYLRGVIISNRTSTNFTLTNMDSNARSGTVLAFRIA